MLKDFTPRIYQETILATAAKKNTLVVLPTGIGKTAIAFMLACQRLKQYPKSKIVLLAPTKPLAEQHLAVFMRHMEVPEEKFVIFTGSVSPEKRKKLWENAQIIIGTPQGFENDLLGSSIGINDVSLIVFDEVHHATGDYSYCFIAKQYMKSAKFPRILGLTASPGSKIEKISEICKNIYAEAVEVRTLSDPDVKPYIKEIKTEWIEVELPEEFNEIKRFLEGCYVSKLNRIKEFGYLDNLSPSKNDLIKLQRGMHVDINGGNRDQKLMLSISILAEAIKVHHAIELVETQGIPPLYNYFQKIEHEARHAKSKAVKNLSSDINFKSAYIKTLNLYEKKTAHPKLTKLLEIVKNESGKSGKIIIFSQYRDSALEIVRQLSLVGGIEARLFVGQSKKRETGMSQKQQKLMIEEFRENKFNILVCTSVGEEGLDIPEVDLVIFYEPVPSAIRHIQRRGRTGRQEIGRVMVLLARNTRDEVYRWAAHHKEKRMYSVLEKIKKEFSFQKQQPLTPFINEEQKVSIVVDHREKGSDVMKRLVGLGISLKLEQLDAADYICSSECGIEFKSVEDFVNSIIDGRFIDQLKRLKQNFSRPLVIVQGERELYGVRKIHPNAIRGMLAAITVGFGIPILQTKNSEDTASLLAIIAKREQDTSRDISLHSRKPMSANEQQEYVVSSLPGTGLKSAIQLLDHFKTIREMACSSKEKLKEVDGIGNILADRIWELFNREYKKE